MSQPNTPWVYVQPLDLTIGVPRKNGSTSVYEALRRRYDGGATVSGAGWIEQSGVCEFVAQPKGCRAIFIVRHPVDRFRSLWANKCLRNIGKVDYHISLDGLTAEELFALIEDDPEGDPHWRSQVSLAGNPEMPIEFVPIEYMGTALLPLQVWRLNDSGSEALPLSDELVQRILNHYSGDFGLYMHARARFEHD